MEQLLEEHIQESTNNDAK